MQEHKLHCGFLLFDGFSNMVLASAIEPLRVAKKYTGEDFFSWQIYSMDGNHVTSSSGLKIEANNSIHDANNLDILFIVAGYEARNHSTPEVIRKIQLRERYIPTFGALDSGAWILAAAGLLNNHFATVHWSEINDFSETYLKVKILNVPYVIDKKRITAGDATSVLELMLLLIKTIGGGALAFNVSNMFYEEKMAKSGNVQSSNTLFSTKHDSQLIRAINIMRDNIEKPLSLYEIASYSAMSVRTLNRLFKREFSTSPGRYYENIRLEIARNLIEETSLNSFEIATRTGYSSYSSLSRAFRLYFGRSLRDFRKERNKIEKI